MLWTISQNIAKEVHKACKRAQRAAATAEEKPIRQEKNEMKKIGLEEQLKSCHCRTCMQISTKLILTSFEDLLRSLVPRKKSVMHTFSYILPMHRCLESLSLLLWYDTYTQNRTVIQHLQQVLFV